MHNKCFPDLQKCYAISRMSRRLSSSACGQHVMRRRLRQNTGTTNTQVLDILKSQIEWINAYMIYVTSCSLSSAV